MNSIRLSISALSLLAFTGFAIAAKPPTEASQLAVLSSSSADVREKARACQELAVWGDAKSVPALAALLGDDKLSDYARSGLESIDDPAAGEALRTALSTLKGRLLAGAVNSLGVRRDTASVPALGKLALDPASGVSAEALASLGMIGTPASVKPIEKVLVDGPEALRVPAAHAALVAAARLSADSHPAAAKRLLQIVISCKLPAHITAAARASGK